MLALQLLLRAHLVQAPPLPVRARRSCPWYGAVRWLQTVQHGPAPCPAAAYSVPRPR